MKTVRPKIDLSSLELIDSVIDIKRVAKVVKGGRRFKLRAIVAVGNKNGYIGLGIGKATETADAIKKATEAARKNIVRVYVNPRGTIPYEIIGKNGASRILLKPAVEGTGIIATESVRNILELAGIKNILTKSLGSNTSINLAKATFNGMMALYSPEDIQMMKRGRVFAKKNEEVANG
ncbi:MAG: 30S ribosomal protein S5 [bacterium]|nr:30S ribosomal protein S5 [bacterium]